MNLGGIHKSEGVLKNGIRLICIQQTNCKVSLRSIVGVEQYKLTIIFLSQKSDFVCSFHAIFVLFHSMKSKLIRPLELS